MSRNGSPELTLSLAGWIRQEQQAGSPRFPLERLEASLRDGIKRGVDRVYLGRRDGMNCYLETREGRVYA